jgi:hypothetical protein
VVDQPEPKTKNRASFRNLFYIPKTKKLIFKNQVNVDFELIKKKTAFSVFFLSFCWIKKVSHFESEIAQQAT